MNKSLLSLAGGLAGSVVCAADIFVGADQVATNCVAKDEVSVQSGIVAVSKYGELQKTGAGAWTIPSKMVAQPTLPLTVVNGSAKVKAEVGSDNPVPAVLATAGFWFSAKDTDHFVTNGDQVQTWYDVRETDMASPTYLRAVANTEKTTDCPTLVSKDGFASVYFGGVGSGQAMTIRNPAGAVNKTAACHVFGVIGYYETQGCVFGSGGTGGTSEIPLMFYIDTNKRISTSYCDPVRKWAWTSRAKIYVDGARCDPYMDIPRAGKFILMDACSPETDKSVSGFFNMWSDKASWGGDYIAEAIVFTNSLTEAERMQVSAYLNKKWFTCAQRTELRIGKSATYLIDDDSVEAQGAAFVPSGDGVLVKQGVGAFAYRAPDVLDAGAFSGSLKLEEGSVDMSTVLPLAVEAGQTIDVRKTDAGNRRVTLATAETGTLVKTGTGEVAVVSLPIGLSKLTVQAGKLEVLPKTELLGQAEEDDEIYIENPSFEDYANDESLIADGGGLSLYSPGSDVYTYDRGWRRQANAVRVFNWDRWTGKSTVWGATRSAFAFNHHPLDGACAVGLFKNALLAAPVTITKPGTYELQFDMSARESEDYYGYYVTCSLWDRDTKTEVMTFGRGYFYELAYHRTALRGEVAKTGNFELRIRAHDLHTDRCVVVDNFRLRRVTDTETGRFAVPNGDFETGDLSFEKEATKAKIVESPYDNWTFVQGEGSVGIVTLVTTNAAAEKRAEYNDSRRPYGGFRQLLLSGGVCSAEVTSQPLAGTYYLRADLGRYAQYRGQLTASVTVGDGAAVPLGTFVVSNSVMKTYTWPVAFTADGSQAVKVTFAFARQQSAISVNCGVWIDDVRFVTFDDREYLRNNGFEGGVTSDNWARTAWARCAASIGNSQIQPYSWSPDIFSMDKIEGNYNMFVQRDGGAEQDVTFDHPGRYRLSFYAARTTNEGRPDEKDRIWCREFNPIRAWFARNGVTNVIGVTGRDCGTNFCQHVWAFDVPAAGTYRFGIQGTYQGKDKGPTAVVDALSIRRVDTTKFVETAPTFDPNTALYIDAGAKMRLSFEGTQKIRRLVLGGRHMGFGEVNISDYPEYFEGTGTFDIKPTLGTVIILE